MSDTDVIITIGFIILAVVGFVVSTIIRIYNYKRLNIKSSFNQYMFGSYGFYKIEDKTPDVKAAEYADLFITSGVIIVGFAIFMYFFIM